MEAGQQGNILIIDEENEANKLLRYNLKVEGFNVVQYSAASDVSTENLTEARIVIVDSMRQDYTGMDLLQAMKEEPTTAHIPVIICCLPEGEELIIEAFEYGVDDFIYKPFSLREMLARINAVLRRYPISHTKKNHHTAEGISLKHLDLVVDTVNRRVLKSGSVLPLTKTEYSIFEFLLKHHNNFFTRDQIYNQIWDEDANINARIVDTNISRLRKKLGDAAKSIINRYGMGYAFVDRG